MQMRCGFRDQHYAQVMHCKICTLAHGLLGSVVEIYQGLHRSPDTLGIVEPVSVVTSDVLTDEPTRPQKSQKSGCSVRRGNNVQTRDAVGERLHRQISSYTTGI